MNAVTPLTTPTRSPMDWSVAQQFNLPISAEVTVPGFSQPGPMTPAIKPDYVFRREVLSDLLAWLKEGEGGDRDGLWISGPTGSGKSSVVREVFARLNLDVMTVNARQRLEVADLIGHLTAIDGDVLFQPGPLTLCARHGWVLMIDEVDLMDPGELAGLNSVLDGSPLVIPENSGEVVSLAPGFGVICTANTGGNGDRSGLYVGTRRMNGALLDRFSLMQVDYPTPEQEQAILQQTCPVLPDAIRDKLIEVANEIRRLFVGDADDVDPIEVTLSTRTLVRWARKTGFFQDTPRPLQHALDRALLLRAEPETRQAILGIVQRVFGEEAA
ncbi:MAG: AAA family ATPase [Candidatus Competibacteraceae bacterium]|nr:AAA family ATPase [Candidatus Competibacteraceae bacterium]